MDKKRYKLFKDLPDALAGDIYEWTGEVYINITRIAHSVDSWTVETSHQWFKEVVEKDWEIVSFRRTNKSAVEFVRKDGDKEFTNILSSGRNYGWTEHELLDAGYFINSVKRNSDGQEFFIGGATNFGVIKTFTVHHYNGQECIMINNENNLGHDIRELEKSSPTPTTFQWTDELVSEFGRAVTSYDAPEYWKKEVSNFKASKQANTTKEEVCGVNLAWEIHCHQTDLSNVMTAQDCRFIGSRRECVNFVSQYNTRRSHKNYRHTFKKT